MGMKTTGITVTVGGSSVGELISITPPGFTKPTIDMTHHGSVTYREFAVGDLMETGEVTMRVAFDPAAFVPVATGVQSVVITFPDSSGASVWTFNAEIMAWAPAAMPVEERAEGDITMKLTGGVTVT